MEKDEQDWQGIYRHQKENLTGLDSSCHALKPPRVSERGNYLETLEIKRLEAEGGTLMTHKCKESKWKRLDRQ